MIAEPQGDRRAEREAADWYARLNQTPIETHELEAFYAWRREPGNDAAYKRVEDIGRAVRDLRGDPDLAAVARAALDRGATRRTRGKRRRLAPYIIGGAMAALACLGGAFLALTAPKTYDTGVGQMTVVRLEDGSRVSLNTDSRLRVRFTKGERRVELSHGQAFFEVAHDTVRPFLVSAGPAEVRAVGTAFDVRADGSGLIRVALAEGRVAVRDDGAHWTLEPGEGIALGADVRSARPTSVNVATVTSWRQGRLIFEDVPLRDAVAEINRYSQTKLVLGAGAPAQKLVSGRFETGDVEDFIKAVTLAYGLRASKAANGQVILST